MPYKIEATPAFLSEAKKLSKKYPSLKNDITALAKQLALTPDQGIPLGKELTKYALQLQVKLRKKWRRKSDHLYKNNFRNCLPGVYL